MYFYFDTEFKPLIHLSMHQKTVYHGWCSMLQVAEVSHPFRNCWWQHWNWWCWDGSEGPWKPWITKQNPQDKKLIPNLWHTSLLQPCWSICHKISSLSTGNYFNVTGITVISAWESPNQGNFKSFPTHHQQGWEAMSDKKLDVLQAFIFIESNTYEKSCFSFNILMNDVTQPFWLTSFSSQNHNPSAQVTCMVVKRLSECCHFPPFSQALIVAAKVIIFSWIFAWPWIYGLTCWKQIRTNGIANQKMNLWKIKMKDI